MRAGIHITHIDDNTVDIVALVPDFVAWERKTKRKSSDLVNGVGVEDLAYLGWHALKRTGAVAIEFDQWLDTVAEVEMGVEPAPKAGRPAASTDSSSN